MNRYSKGARGERELLAILAEMEYSVIRSAGSGVNALSPDIIALKDGIALCFECKAWDSGSVSLDEEHYGKMAKWANNTSFPTYLAWRMNGKGWFFIRLDEFTKGEKNYNITRKKAMALNRRLGDVIGSLAKQQVQQQTAVQPV